MMIYKFNYYICFLKIYKHKIMYIKLRYLIFTFLLVFSSFSVISQNVNPCGTNEMLELEIEKFPEIKDLRYNFEKDLEKYLSSNRYSKMSGNESKRIIPVVFHVIHEGGAESTGT